MGHIAFGITAVRSRSGEGGAEKRGLTARVETGGRGDIHTAWYKLPHDDAERYDLQISATTRANRAG